MLTVEEKINIGKVSQFLTANHIAKTGLWGSGLDLRRPRLLYMVRKNVEWMYNLDPTNETLIDTSHYLYAISWNNLRAQRILNISGGGGSISPVTPPSSSLLNDLDWVVGDTASPIAPLADGESYVYLNGEDGMPDFRGLGINYFRGAATQNTTPLGDGSTYYYWNRITGLFQLLGGAPAFGAAQTGELMRITPDRLGDSSSSSTTSMQTIFLDADGTYTLANGLSIWKIKIKPTAADTVRIGTTLNGEEVMMDKVMLPNVYGLNGVTADIDTEGSSQVVYFTGFTAQAQIDIYFLSL